MSDLRPTSALTIAGSDSGGGAGIQADLKAFAAHAVHGLSAIAALTAQNTRGVSAVHVPPVEFLRAQVDACFGDFRIGAVKLGMLATADVIHAVADALERRRPPHVVLDPVMVATSGAKLLADDALDAMRARLLPQWNRPVYWPLLALALGVVALVAGAVRQFRRHEYAVALAPHAAADAPAGGAGGRGA